MVWFLLNVLPLVPYVAFLLWMAWRNDRRVKAAYEAGHNQGLLDSHNARPVIFSMN